MDVAAPFVAHRIRLSRRAPGDHRRKRDTHEQGTSSKSTERHDFLLLAGRTGSCSLTLAVSSDPCAVTLPATSKRRQRNARWTAALNSGHSFAGDQYGAFFRHGYPLRLVSPAFTGTLVGVTVSAYEAIFPRQRVSMGAPHLRE